MLDRRRARGRERRRGRLTAKDGVVERLGGIRDLLGLLVLEGEHAHRAAQDRRPQLASRNIEEGHDRRRNLRELARNRLALEGPDRTAHALDLRRIRDGDVVLEPDPLALRIRHRADETKTRHARHQLARRLRLARGRATRVRVAIRRCALYCTGAERRRSEDEGGDHGERAEHGRRGQHAACQGAHWHRASKPRKHRALVRAAARVVISDCAVLARVEAPAQRG